MLRLADTRQLITFDEVRSLTVEVIARELDRVVEVVHEGYFACDTVFDYTPTPLPCDLSDVRHNQLKAYNNI